MPNPFLVFFLGGRITDIVYTISVNHFQLKFLISEDLLFSCYIY